jgi:hypothetical protein
MAKLKISNQTAQTSVTYPAPAGDRYISPTLINGLHYGGVGGTTTNTGLQIKPTVYVNAVGATAAAGSILAQKGSHKFRVTDGTYTGVCKLVNSTTLAAGQMNLWANVCIIPSATMASANVAGGATSATVTWTAGTTIGPVATPRVGDYLVGFPASPSISAYGAQVTGVTNATTVTVLVSGNVAATTTLANAMTLVSRIDNKYVHDFISDGQQDSTNGTTNYYTTGYNPTKFRYVSGGNAISASATITSGFARVISA